jgi:uncharacterized protein
VLWQHRAGEPVGPYRIMAEDKHGLFVEGQLLVEDVVRAKEARALMKAKAVNGLSIGFVTREDSYDKVTGVRTLTKVDLWEVSIVTFAANPLAQINSVKSAIDVIESLAEAEAFLRDVGRLTKSQSTAFISRIKSMQGRSDSDELGDVKAALIALQSSLS